MGIGQIGSLKKVKLHDLMGIGYGGVSKKVNLHVEFDGSWA